MKLTKDQKQTVRREVFKNQVFAHLNGQNKEFSTGNAYGYTQALKQLGVRELDLWAIQWAAQEWIRDGGCPAHLPENKGHCVSGCNACTTASIVVENLVTL